MLYAITGDILGSSIEFVTNKPLREKISLQRMALKGYPTDDTIMTLATWKWWLDYQHGKTTLKS